MKMTILPNPEASASTLIGGRYGLVRQLAVGGMAEVWLARQLGLEGFEKLVVVKRILPHLASNPEFVQMFLDEARTAADLRHTNVASVTDVGTEAGAYFIAMEYLHGQDLAHVVQRCKVRGELVPLQHALQIVSEAAQGLDYAHRKVDRHGAAQQIVHRDVSPQNLLVTYEGATKLLDFGIASASHRSTHTEAGVVKGKYAYMSPEQFEGSVIDARSDLFSLGVVLWELVTMQRLFWRPSDAETLRAVMECKVPRPTSLVTECTPALEEVILRCLALKPDKRFASCGHLVDAIDELLDAARLPHSAARVGAWMRGIFPEHTLDPTETPVPPPAPPEAATRNEKILPVIGSQTHQASRPAAIVHVVAGPPSRSHRPQAKAFFGRHAELAQLAAHLGPSPCLVTIAGGMGQGKSRLATRFVENHLELWKSRQWTVELASARSLEEAVWAIVLSCGLELDGISQTSEQLVAQCGRMLDALGPGLLVLDNFDLPDAGSAVAQWRTAAAQLSVLVTRRTPLGVREEAVVGLSGLDARTTDSEAVRMFVSHVVSPGAAPMSAAELEPALKICQLLEGVPMALELVGAHADAMTMAALLLRLSAPPLGEPVVAHAIDWTCQQLRAVERTALSQLSVFRGGFTLDAAAQVVDLNRDEEIASIVGSLVRRGLLRPYFAPELPGRVRFRMPRTVESWVLSRAAARPETAPEHARWALQLADSSRHELHGAAAADRLAQLSVERDNLLSVFERSVAPNASLRALSGLEPLLSRLGPTRTHLALLEKAIAAAVKTGGDAAILARALQQRARVLRRCGQQPQALDGMTEALEQARLARDRVLEGQVCCDRAQTCFIGGDVEGAIAGFDRAQEIARQIANVGLEVTALAMKASAYVARGELSKALAACDKALPLARTRGDALNEARVLGTVGSLFLEERRTELARAFFSDAVARCSHAEELPLKGYLLGKLAQVLAERAEHGEARIKVAEALKVLRQTGELRHEGLFLSFSGTLDALDGRLASAKVSLAEAGEKLEAARDPLLLTAHALRKMHLKLLMGEVPVEAAVGLLNEVRSPSKTDAPPRATQSDEVRLAAQQLERGLAR